jgi:Ca-activated chloride channel family protein
VQDVDRIVAVIDAMRSEGSTNMEAGLMLGYDQARAAFRPGGLNVVVLASDGVANVGSTDPTVLTEQITKAGEQGIHLVTVGYGMGNYNDFLMEQLADRGDGFYSYVDTLAEARRLFVSDLTPTLTVVAKDAKIQVRFDPAVVDTYRLIGYENRMMDDEQFDNAAADAGELGAGHRVSALYEVRLKAGATGPAAAEVALRWTSTEGGAQELRRPVTLSSGAVPTATKLAATVAGVAEVLRGNSVVTARGLTLDALLADAQELRAANVNGADQLVELILQAKDASPAPAATTVEG